MSGGGRMSPVANLGSFDAVGVSVPFMTTSPFGAAWPFIAPFTGAICTSTDILVAALV